MQYCIIVWFLIFPSLVYGMEIAQSKAKQPAAGQPASPRFSSPPVSPRVASPRMVSPRRSQSDASSIFRLSEKSQERMEVIVENVASNVKEDNGHFLKKLADTISLLESAEEDDEGAQAKGYYGWLKNNYPNLSDAQYRMFLNVDSQFNFPHPFLKALALRYIGTFQGRPNIETFKDRSVTLLLYAAYLQYHLVAQKLVKEDVQWKVPAEKAFPDYMRDKSAFELDFDLYLTSLDHLEELLSMFQFPRKEVFRLQISGQNGLTSISKPFWVRFINVTVLNLSGNNLKDLPENWASQCACLHDLDLSYNQLPIFSEKSFPHLIELNLSYNKLVFLGLTCNTIRKLNVSHNGLKSLSLEGAKCLEVLDASHNELEMLPDDLLAESTFVGDVDLSHNHLIMLPAAFLEGNAKLRRLFLNANRLRTLPDFIKNIEHTHRTKRGLNQLALENNPVGISRDVFIGFPDLRLSLNPVVGDVNANNTYKGVEIISESRYGFKTIQAVYFDLNGDIFILGENSSGRKLIKMALTQLAKDRNKDEELKLTLPKEGAVIPSRTLKFVAACSPTRRWPNLMPYTIHEKSQAFKVEGSVPCDVCIFFKDTEDMMLIHEGNGKFGVYELDGVKNAYRGNFQTQATGDFTVCFDPVWGSKQFVLAYGKTMELWDYETGKCIDTFPMEHVYPIYLMRFSPDGKRLVSVSEDRTVTIWDFKAQEVERTYVALDRVTECVFNQDAGLLACLVEGDKPVRIYNIDDGTHEDTPLKLGKALCFRFTQFSYDDRKIDASKEHRYLITQQRLDGSIYIWCSIHDKGKH